VICGCRVIGGRRHRTEHVLRIPVGRKFGRTWSSSAGVRRGGLSSSAATWTDVVAWVCQCVDGNKRRQLSLASWRVAVVERRSVYSGSRRHCVWWTTRGEEHYQHWSLLRVVKLICLTVLLFWTFVKRRSTVHWFREDWLPCLGYRWVERYCMFMLYVLYFAIRLFL